MSEARDALTAAQAWIDRAATLADRDPTVTDANAEHVTARLHVLHELAMAQLNLAMNCLNVETADAQNEANRKAATAQALGIPTGPTALRPRG